MSSERSDRVSINGIALEVRRRGKGSPLLVLCGEEELEFDSPWLSDLAQKHELIIPSAPGFGQSERPDWITNVDDMSYIYLDLVEKLGLKAVPVVGFSFGGWIAAEMASKDDSFISKLVLVGALRRQARRPAGARHRRHLDAASGRGAQAQVARPGQGQARFPVDAGRDARVVARNVESFARFCWDPYMHNPKLRHRLHRIKVPTLLVWGDKDGIVTPALRQSLRQAHSRRAVSRPWQTPAIIRISNSRPRSTRCLRHSSADAARR